jgi:putative membrane protein
MTLVALLLPRAARAHPGGALAPHDLWRAWTPAPVVLIGLLVGGALYVRGIHTLWRRGGRGRALPPWRAAAFAGALLTLFVALISPLDALGSALFSAHMVQHLLLMMVAAPLMALGEPLLVSLWALPVRWRRALARRWIRARRLRDIWRAISVPAVAWLLHVGFLWSWHLPVLYERALRSDEVHAMEHATFFLTALLFWWLLSRRHGRRMRVGGAVAYLFGAALLSTILGAAITMSRRPWYPSHFGTTQAWGLAPLEDQQLAGLLMWIPAGIVYLVPLVPLLARILSARIADSPAGLATRRASHRGCVRPRNTIVGEQSVDLRTPADQYRVQGVAQRGVFAAHSHRDVEHEWEIRDVDFR